MKCYICDGEKISKRRGKVRDNDKLDILQCDHCGLVFLSSYPNFDHIDNKFYEESKMRAEDKEKNIEEMLESAREDDERRYNYLKDKIKGKFIFILDYGCGAGGFMELSGAKFGVEPEDQTRNYLKEKGYVIFKDLIECEKSGLKFDYITLFHTLEHLKHPREVLKQLKSLLNPGGRIVIEVPNADDALLTMYDCKAFSEFTYWAPHLYLFNSNSFYIMAKDLGMEVNYLKHIQRYSLSNHIWWLMEGKPGGQKIMSFLNDEKLMKEYERTLADMEVTDTILVELRNVA